MPREGHDERLGMIRTHFTNFNPRAPRGARRRVVGANGRVIKFQSTCPARGTTSDVLAAESIARISIHVPREGHDQAVFYVI